MAHSEGANRSSAGRHLISAVRAQLPSSLNERLAKGVSRSREVAETWSRAQQRTVTTRAFFELTFGHPPDEGDLMRLAELLPDGFVSSAADAHRVLAAFDAQHYRTQFLVRATVASLRRLELDGFTLWIDQDDPSVSAVVADHAGWEAHVAGALTTALGPGSTFVDVGANVGYHSFLAASIVGPSGSVLAFEPSSENCRLLQLSKLDNDAENLLIMPVALDRDTGIRCLTSHIGTNAGLIPDTREDLLAGLGTPVYATTLDQVAPPRVDVLKIDVEGAEFRVLDGARKTIERDKPVIVMEFSREMAQRVSGVEPADALQAVLDLGYRLFMLDRHGRGPIAFGSAALMLVDWRDPFRIEDLLLRPA